ncbi:MAG: peptidoglycan-associated lipoprotein Pal [Deltaproteobacteria bacterium]|jgi:peptidoglycan-associated lipoprotein|nr:peptidoglycan-associated lipoprotein Pal [Deltaproteobacteria bacterium]MBW2504774.1 peptidoglycan-associated lipoprotein Pal [Deltaproteobacteria bacterium]
MNRLKGLAFLLFLIALAVWLNGCSTTPSTPPVDEQAQVGSTDIGQQPDIAGIGDQEIREEGVPSHEDVAGLQRIHFDFDQFTLSDEARDTLTQNANYLKANSSIQVVIEGHCDERGSDEYNLALGESRALAAKQYLISLGISPQRLSVISYGEEKPLDPRTTEEAWALNRRAEFKAIQ